MRFKGLRELKRDLKNAGKLEGFQNAVKKNTLALQREAVRQAEFRGHYERVDGRWKFVKPTGATRRSILPDFPQGKMVGRVSSGTAYSGYLEDGTRHMDAQPFMKPALDKIVPQFLDDLEAGGFK